MTTSMREATIGFGCPDRQGVHHFTVTIPSGKGAPVCIAENFGIDDENMARCFLPRSLWEKIADDVRVLFNQRLKSEGMKTGRWNKGETRLDRLLGKELLVLAWSVEEATPEEIPFALKNWMGLHPSERWWLCTMTAAATGRADEKGRGWRKALYHIMVENPVS